MVFDHRNVVLAGLFFGVLRPWRVGDLLPHRARHTLSLADGLLVLPLQELLIVFRRVKQTYILFKLALESPRKLHLKE